MMRLSPPLFESMLRSDPAQAARVLATALGDGELALKLRHFSASNGVDGSAICAVHLEIASPEAFGLSRTPHVSPSNDAVFVSGLTNSDSVE